MNPRHSALASTVGALAVVIAACGGSPDPETGDTLAADSPAMGAVDCPVTIPDGSFIPPEDYPASPSIGGMEWYGTAELWTALPSDPTTYGQRKSVWWSTAFPGGEVEERPPIVVTYTSATTGEIHTHDDGTNAYTVEDGWFMIAGIDPDAPGCWTVEASYKGATLRYVYRTR